MKARIEAGMAKKLAELKASYSAHSQDLENVVKHRAQELK